MTWVESKGPEARERRGKLMSVMLETKLRGLEGDYSANSPAEFETRAVNEKREGINYTTENVIQSF